MKNKKIPRKNNLVIVEKISRFIRDLAAEDTNSQISQNRARLCAFKIISSFHPIFWLRNNCVVTYINEILVLETM